MTPTMQTEIGAMMSGIQRERANMRELEQSIQIQQLEQKQVVEEILRANERDVDMTAETNLKLKRLQAKFDETCSLNDELQEQLEWTNLRLKEQQKTLELFKPREPSGDRSRNLSGRRGESLEQKTTTEISQSYRPTQHRTVLNQDSYSRTYSQEPIHNTGIVREESRDLEQYVASNQASASEMFPDSRKPAELSEEFNRKQMVGGRAAALLSHIADSTGRSRVTELRHYQPETFGVDEQEQENEHERTSFTNEQVSRRTKNRDRPVSFAQDTFDPDLGRVSEYVGYEEEKGLVVSQSQTSQSQVAPTPPQDFSRRESDGINLINRRYQHTRGQGAATQRVEAQHQSSFPGLTAPI